MNPQFEELATLYVLDQLDAAERTAFEARLLREPTLAALVRELESTLAHSVHALPPTPPPADLLARIEARIAPSAPRQTSPPSARSPARLTAFFRWGLAAVIAVSLATLAVQSFRRPSPPLVVVIGLDAHGSTFTEFPLRQPTRDPDARFIQLASLAQQFWSSPDQLPVDRPAATATNRGYALFDPSSQQGFIAIEQLPALAPAQRYHLWTVDTTTGEVRDAGTLPLSDHTHGLYSFSVSDRARGKKSGQLKFFVTVEDVLSPSRPHGKVVLGSAPL